MATNAIVAIKQPKSGLYKYIYVNCDGYLEGVGKTLLEHYNTEDRVNALINLGDCSALRESIECPPGPTGANPVDGYTNAYYRDRGERYKVHAIEHKEDMRNASYMYVFEDGKWSYATAGKYSFKSL